MKSCLEISSDIPGFSGCRGLSAFLCQGFVAETNGAGSAGTLAGTTIFGTDWDGSVVDRMELISDLFVPHQM